MTGGGGRAISTVWAVDGVLWGCARVSRANRVDPGSEVCSSLLRDRGCVSTLTNTKCVKVRFAMTGGGGRAISTAWAVDGVL